MAEARCMGCKSLVPVTNNFCPNCGASLAYAKGGRPGLTAGQKVGIGIAAGFTLILGIGIVGSSVDDPLPVGAFARAALGCPDDAHIRELDRMRPDNYDGKNLVMTARGCIWIDEGTKWRAIYVGDKHSLVAIEDRNGLPRRLFVRSRDLKQ